ncbi:hypothetical protein NEMIN01_0603 [Nematocida minor]|uniref:uncharacterized protein n=1 Tax=Nematocida minor TaxID=1912983 RepID=UPI0022206392|nr:uncharacterized protein NEMIN01_0603 [Nematocida minor]KAI5189650.1 hypothetical protein NEMIN01_0603 [Nematocida minor]
MSVEQRLLALADLPPKEMYAKLCEIKQQGAEEDTNYIAGKISECEKGLRHRKHFHLLYATIEILRIAAPHNPFSEESIKEAFKQLVHKGPRHSEDKRAFEIIAHYRMVSLIDSVKTINTLAELALLNLSQKWSLEMLQSIVEEKEEDLGREVKIKIAKRVAEGSSLLEVFIEKYPVLFMPAVSEVIRAAKKSQIELVRKFNTLSKEVVTMEVIEAIINERNNKKEFLAFVGDAAVRQEMLKAVEDLSEDRSAWIRCQVPIILLNKSKSIFYTSAAAASIRNSALEIIKRRMHDSSSQVRLGMLKEITPAVMSDLSEVKHAVVERLRDTSRDVRKEALKILALEYSEVLQKDANEIHRNADACFICRKKETQSTFLVDLLLSIFINDHAVQVSLVKTFFNALTTSERFGRDVLHMALLAEIFCMVLKSPEDIETLTGCSSALGILGINSFEKYSVCSSHGNTVELLMKILGPDLYGLEVIPTKDSPISMVIMLCEGYPKGSIPQHLLNLLKLLLPSVSEDTFYRIARILTVTEHNGGNGWGEAEEYTGYSKQYLEIKQITSSNAYDFSMDISRMEDNSMISAGNVSVDISEQEKKLDGYCKKMLMMVQMDLLECCIRSALLERAIFKYFLSHPYTDHTYFEKSLFFKQRLVIGIRSHPDVEIRLMFSVLSVLVCQQTSLTLNSKSVISILSFLCWVSIEYTRARAVEAVCSLFRSNVSLAQEFFSFFTNLKRLQIEDTDKQNELYILSEEVCSMLVKETSKLGINPAQYSNDMPPGLCEELKLRGGWATALFILDDDHFSANLLTVFKQKNK